MPTGPEKIMRKRRRENDAKAADLRETNKKVRALEQELEDMTLNAFNLNKLVSKLSLGSKVTVNQIHLLANRFEKSLR